MKMIPVPKKVFNKILTDAETLIEDVELALDEMVRKRIFEIESGLEKGKTETEYYDYLEKRGIKVGRLRN